MSIFKRFGEVHAERQAAPISIEMLKNAEQNRLKEIVRGPLSPSSAKVMAVHEIDDQQFLKETANWNSDVPTMIAASGRITDSAFLADMSSSHPIPEVRAALLEQKSRMVGSGAGI